LYLFLLQRRDESELCRRRPDQRPVTLLQSSRRQSNHSDAQWCRECADAIAEQGVSPAFPYFDAQGHVVARHLDGSLVGPATLFPGASTPAKAGETVILAAFGMGHPNNFVEGSAVQTAPIPQSQCCWISGLFTRSGSLH
jgi:hypothetical protein